MKNKIYKVLSVFLTILILLSTCTCVIGTVSAETVVEYFVRANGNDSGQGTQQIPLKTIKKAIEKAEALRPSLGAEDTVQVKILQTNAISWASSGNTLPEHDFKLVISTLSDVLGTVGGTKDIQLGGPTEFKNVKINYNNKVFSANGNDVTFGDGVEYSTDHSSANFVVGKKSGNATFNGDVTVVSRIPIKNFGLANDAGDVTHNGNINVTYNASTGTPNFALSSSNGTTTYNAGVNLQILSASSVTFSKGDKISFGTNGYINVFNNTATALTKTQFAGVPSDNLWIVNNKTGAASILKKVVGKGEFEVDTEGFSNIKAVNSADPENPVEPVGGVLKLTTPGEWNITAVKNPSYGTYYVQNNGRGDGSTPDSPLGTIKAAVRKAITEGGFMKGDEVTIKVVGTDSVKFDGEVPSHDFKLIITSNTEQEATVGEGKDVILGGPTEFKNITVYFGGMIENGSDADKYKTLQGNGNDITFGDGVTYGGNSQESLFSAVHNNGNITYDESFTIKTQIPIINFRIAGHYGSKTFNKNVNIEYDSRIIADRYPTFNLATSNGTTTYNAGLNLNLVSARAVAFQYTGVVFGENGYMQILNTTDNKVIPADMNLGNIDPNKLYVLNNISGNKNLIKLTDKKGEYEFTLDSTEHKLVVINTKTQERTIRDGKDALTGIVTLDPGLYDVTIDRAPLYPEYYVDSINGLSLEEGGLGTKEKPVKTYCEATKLIAEQPLFNIDVATIYIASGIKNEWGEKPSSFKCKLIIDSDGEDPGTLESDTTRGNMLMTSDTILRNVNVNVGYHWGEFLLNEHNLTIEEDATLTAPKFYTWDIAANKKRVDDISIIVKGTLSASGIFHSASYHDHTSTADLNIVWDNPDMPLSLRLGPESGESRGAEGPNIYEGNINIAIKRANSFSIFKTTKGAELKGSLNIIIDDSVLLPYNTKKNFNDFEVEGGKWYITNTATDSEFIDFTADKGKFAVKNNTSYTRQGDGPVITHTGKVITLPEGSHVISDKNDVPIIVDNPEKMLYYRLGGGGKHIAQRASPLVDNETYVYEYTIFSQAYDLVEPIVVEDNRNRICEVKIISDTKIGNFHKVVCEFTIPDGTNDAEGEDLFFVGQRLSAHDEGLILDRTVYNKKDATKTDLFEGGNKLHNALDYITLNYDFWGAIFAGETGGKGKVEWTDGYQELKVMDKDLSYADYLLYLNNPQDGEWWSKDDLLSEDGFATYGKAKGTFKDQNGKGIKGIKFLLVSDEKTYSSTTNSKGKFDFGTILTGFYDLLIVNGKENINTGFTSYISQDDVVTFNVVSDTSGLIADANSNNQGMADFESNSDGETVEEIVASGNLKGAVYTPKLETVPNLKVILKGIGEAVTDENGAFGFADIPVGEYEIYAINSDGSEYLFRKVTIKENITLDVKLKYEPPIESNADESDNGWIIWVIVASVVALLVVAALVFFLVIKKKKSEIVPTAE